MSLKVLWQRIMRLLGSDRILCDTCMYDYGSACVRPERPNAAVCPDFRRRETGR